MTYRFLPSPYCEFTKMREQVYYHLFPDSKNDEELHGVVDAHAEWAVEVVDRLHAILTDMGHDPRQSRYWDWMEAYGVTDARKLPKDARISDFNDAIEAKRIQSLSAALKSGEFDPLRWFFPKPDGHSWVTPVVPNKLKAFRSTRWKAIQHLTTDALYRGEITAYFKSNDGITAIDDKNVWLNNTVATSALERGTIEYNPRKFRTSLGRFELIFDGEELGTRFPPLNNPDAAVGRVKGDLPDHSQRQQTKGGRRNKLSPAIEALRRLHPNGRPDISNEMLRRQVEGEIGMTVGVSTMTKAISEVWGN